MLWYLGPGCLIRSIRTVCKYRNCSFLPGLITSLTDLLQANHRGWIGANNTKSTGFPVLPRSICSFFCFVFAKVFFFRPYKEPVCRLCFFCYFLFLKYQFMLHELVTQLNWLIPDLAESSSLVSWLFVSPPQTTPRTANIFLLYYLVLPCGLVMTIKKSFFWLKLPHTSYISLLNQAEKGGVFYSVDKCFETGADPCNFCK